MKKLVLGLGNTILSDDGVGIWVVRALKDRLNREDTTVVEASAGGLDILDLLIGYDKAVIIDAIQTRGGKAGSIYKIEPESFDSTRYATNPHDLNFATALQLGNKLGLDLPKKISILAIEVENVTSFKERCTLAVEQTIPVVTNMVLKEIDAD